jgi:DNA-directed RNA polymerase specialized sigma24 family protein
VKGDLIQSAEQTRGKLRSFLLGALNRHLVDHLRHQNTENRGGRAIVLPIDCYTAEERFSAETTDYRDPESLFMSAWARTLLDRVRARLRAHYASSGRGEWFDALQAFVSLDGDESSYAEVARQQDTSESALRLLVFRMRKRFGKMLREAVAETVETEDEAEEEMAWLQQVLRVG